MTTITYEEFERVNLRSGTIVKVEEFPRAKKPAFKVWADFGPEVGVLQTSAQVTVHYTPESIGQIRAIKAKKNKGMMKASNY